MALSCKRLLSMCHAAGSKWSRPGPEIFSWAAGAPSRTRPPPPQARPLSCRAPPSAALRQPSVLTMPIAASRHMHSRRLQVSWRCRAGRQGKKTGCL